MVRTRPVIAQTVTYTYVDGCVSNIYLLIIIYVEDRLISDGGSSWYTRDK